MLSWTTLPHPAGRVVHMFGAVLDEKSDTELVELLRAREQLRRSVEAEIAELVSALDRRGAYRTDGHTTINGLVRTVTKRPTWKSKEAARIGKLLHQSPAIAAAL